MLLAYSKSTKKIIKYIKRVISLSYDITLLIYLYKYGIIWIIKRINTGDIIKGVQSYESRK